MSAGERVDPRRDRRRKAILEAAKDKFLKRGYGATTLADIVQTSGGSLATVYQIFGNKAGLLRAMVTEHCTELTESLVRADLESEPLEVALTNIASSIIELSCSSDGVALLRVVIAECGRFPEIGPDFLETGLFPARSRLVAFLARQAREGRLDIDDAEGAATMFQQMAASDFYLRMLVGVPLEITAEMRRSHGRNVVRTFLRAYSVRSGKGVAAAAG